MVRQMPLELSMKLWDRHAAAISRRHPNSRHAFVIGPLCSINPSTRKARLYYCRLCKWSFLVCGSKVAVLDEDGKPLVGEESLRRFSTFEEGPCPVLESFASVAVADAGRSRFSFRRKYNELSNLASRHFPTRPVRPRPGLRALNRLRENLGRH